MKFYSSRRKEPIVLFDATGNDSPVSVKKQEECLSEMVPCDPEESSAPGEQGTGTDVIVSRPP